MTTIIILLLSVAFLILNYFLFIRPRLEMTRLSAVIATPHRKTLSKLQDLLKDPAAEEFKRVLFLTAEHYPDEGEMMMWLNDVENGFLEHPGDSLIMFLALEAMDLWSARGESFEDDYFQSLCNAVSDLIQARSGLAPSSDVQAKCALEALSGLDMAFSAMEADTESKPVRQVHPLIMGVDDPAGKDPILQGLHALGSPLLYTPQATENLHRDVLSLFRTYHPYATMIDFRTSLVPAPGGSPNTVRLMLTSQNLYTAAALTALGRGGAYPSPLDISEPDKFTIWSKSRDTILLKGTWSPELGVMLDRPLTPPTDQGISEHEPANTSQGSDQDQPLDSAGEQAGVDDSGHSGSHSSGEGAGAGCQPAPTAEESEAEAATEEVVSSAEDSALDRP